MIPHPLTLLYCFLLGLFSSGLLGPLLQFAVEVLADLHLGGAERGILLLLGWTVAAARGAFYGFFMRLLAEERWTRAAAWAAGGITLIAFVGMIGRPFTALALPGLAFQALGAAGGAYLCERWIWREQTRGLQTLLRNLMFWERGGA